MLEPFVRIDIPLYPILRLCLIYIIGSTSSASGNANGNGNGSNNGSGNSNTAANGSTDSSDSSKSGGNNTVLIAAVSGAVGGCLLLAGIVFFFYRRRLKRKHAAPPPPAPTANPTVLDSTPMAGGKAQPMQFQGGPMALVTPPSTYVPSMSGDSSSNYNYTAPLSPQWTGMTGAASTHLGHPPPSLHPSSYYTTSRPDSTVAPTPVSSPPPPWAVPMDPNSQAHLQHPQAHPQYPQAYMSAPNLAPPPGPFPGAEKAQFSGYAVPVHQNPLPAWAIDHKRPGVAPGPSNSAGPSGSGTGGTLPNVLEQPGDTLPPPAYTATPSSL